MTTKFPTTRTIRMEDITMNEDTLRALLEKIDEEKKFPAFTELRKRVVESLPRLLDRECSEIIDLIPRIPINPKAQEEIEKISLRLINSGHLATTANGDSILLDDGSQKLVWRNKNHMNSTFSGSFHFSSFEGLRAKVLEALPVLMGWLDAHAVIVQIPVEPLSTRHLDRMFPFSGVVTTAHPPLNHLHSYSLSPINQDQ